MTIGVTHSSPRAVKQPCVVVAFWFEDGIAEEQAKCLVNTFSKLSAYYLRILEPSWLLAVYPDDLAMRRSVADALTTLLKKPDGHELNHGLHIGVERGDVLMSLDQHRRSLSHPVGSPMSGAMKKARESGDNTPVGLNELNS